MEFEYAHHVTYCYLMNKFFSNKMSLIDMLNVIYVWYLYCNCTRV